MIDKEIFSTFFNFPDKKKINNGFGKFFIREFLDERIPFYNSFQKKSGFTVPIDQWIPEMSKNLSDILPKLECLTYIIPSSLIKDLCLSLQYNKNSVIPVWRLIFFALWYFYNVDKKKIEGNTFDILNENL